VLLISLNLGRAKRENWSSSLNLGPACPSRASTTALQLVAIEMHAVVSSALAKVDDLKPLLEVTPIICRTLRVVVGGYDFQLHLSSWCKELPFVYQLANCI
jgi:hypothetical protein